MPSLLHEALLLLFRNRPELIPELIRGALHVPLPQYTQVRLESAELTEVAPVQYHADLTAVLLTQDVPVLALIVEVQRARDPDKRWTWPLYATSLRAQLRCPVCLLVICPDAAVARWCAEPIELGQPGAVFTPLVLGFESVPAILDRQQALTGTRASGAIGNGAWS